MSEPSVAPAVTQSHIYRRLHNRTYLIPINDTHERAERRSCRLYNRTYFAGYTIAHTSHSIFNSNKQYIYIYIYRRLHNRTYLIPINDTHERAERRSCRNTCPAGTRVPLCGLEGMQVLLTSYTLGTRTHLHASHRGPTSYTLATHQLHTSNHLRARRAH